MTTTPHTNLPGADPVGGEDRPWFDFYHQDVPRAIPEIHETSLSEMVAHAAQRYGDKVAFSNLGATLSFNEVDRHATKFAAYLQNQLGLVKGDRVVIQMPNLLQYPVAFFGALRAGLIVVNANPLYTASEMSKVIADAEPRAIIALANFADKVEKVVPGSTIEHVIITQVGDMLPQPKRALINFVAGKVKKMVPQYDLPDAIDFRTVLTGAGAATFTDPGIELSDPACLQYTGGTTGGTKAAVLSHWNLLANQEQFIGLMKSALTEGDSTIIAALPLYHVFALTVNMLGFFRFGAHNVLVTNPRDLPAFIKTIDSSKPDGILVVSTLAGALIEQPNFAKVDFSNLKITVAGGMALRTMVAHHWEQITGNQIIEGYGLTEASPVVAVNPPHLTPRLGTIGVALPSTDVKIVDDNLKTVPNGEPGELAVKGPQVMSGYWNQPGETAQVLTDDGWLLTGDVATMADDGYLHIVDRKKEIIVVSGFNVYPGDIEDAAMMNEKVMEAGAISIPDEKSGEVPKLYVVKHDPSLTVDELREFLREHLTAYKRPKEIVFIPELPKTNVGKVLRRRLPEFDEVATTQ